MHYGDVHMYLHSYIPKNIDFKTGPYWFLQRPRRLHRHGSSWIPWGVIYFYLTSYPFLTTLKMDCNELQQELHVETTCLRGSQLIMILLEYM